MSSPQTWTGGGEELAGERVEEGGEGLVGVHLGKHELRAADSRVVDEARVLHHPVAAERVPQPPADEERVSRRCACLAPSLKLGRRAKLSLRSLRSLRT